MNLLRIRARNAAEAIGQIHAQLGADAVVLSVKPLPVNGLSRLWRRPGLEVIAGLHGAAADAAIPTSSESLAQSASSPKPNAAPPRAVDEASLATLGITHDESVALLPTSELGCPLSPQPNVNSANLALETSKPNSLRPVSLLNRASAVEPGDAPAELAAPSVVRDPCEASSRLISGTPDESIGRASPPSFADGWRRSGLVLRQLGLLPLNVEKVLERVRASHGDVPPSSFAEEMALVRVALASFWQPMRRPTNGSAPVHIFVGPPGSGKTTALCKWLTASVMHEGLSARAWRLDGRAANFAGLLDLYSEILGVPVAREWAGPNGMAGCQAGFIDLPGVNPYDAPALEQIRALVQSIPSAQVHLVLNAAYDASVLLDQVRPFAALPALDLIFTHLDEEKRRGKLWNFVLGTNCTLSFLSGGQNIPGDFAVATPELLISS